MQISAQPGTKVDNIPDPAATMANIQSHKNVFNTLKAPLALYSILFGAYMFALPGKYIWFSWHPLFMLLSFVTFAGNAALIKKIGGYENTKMHGNLMMLAVIGALFAWYVIYTNKENFGKPHLTSIHGKLGVGVIVGYIGVGMFGATALHPDFGLMKTNKEVRMMHRWAGRTLTALAWVCCVLGKNERLNYIRYR